MYGPERLLRDLADLGYAVEQVIASEVIYAVIPKFEIEFGRFQGRIIDLGISSTPDFPRTVASSIHVRANPQLYEKHDSIQNVRNIIDSPLGPDWRYWSRNFGWTGEKTTQRLMAQIKGILENA
jgi:hypothetical protein